MAVVMALVSSCFYTPRLEYIDFGVLCILSSLMLVVGGLKSVRFLDYMAVELVNKCATSRQLVMTLVGMTYFASMFVTNDVALLTFVPLALVIGRSLQMDVGRIVILQTLAANLGSMLTPPGNPQNLFLYAHYGYTAMEFFHVMALPALLSAVYIIILVHRRKDAPLSVRLPLFARPEPKRTLLYIALLLLNIAAVLHVLDCYTAFALTALCIFAVQKELFRQIDYSLLATFVGFFIFIGNISHVEAVSSLQASFLGTAEGTYLVALLSSQFISNVPAAMLLAGLTEQADALLLGVDVGGLGTLIASMASVISYKLFAAEHPYQASSYLRMFLYYNFAGLLLLGGAVYLFLLA